MKRITSRPQSRGEEGNKYFEPKKNCKRDMHARRMSRRRRRRRKRRVGDHQKKKRTHTIDPARETKLQTRGDVIISVLRI